MEWRDLSGELHKIMADMAHAQDQLNTEILQTTLQDAVVSELPEVFPEDELIEPDRIDVIPYYGEEALDRALAGFARFHTGDDLSKRVVWRLPGAIALQAHQPRALIDLVEVINTLRHRFRETALSVANEDERYDLIHHAFPGTIYLQVVRKLRIMEGPVQSVTFTWGRKPGSELITVESADAKLEWAGRHPSASLLRRTGLSERSLRERVYKEREALSKLPLDTPIRWRRQLRVRPLMNIRLPSQPGEKPVVLQREATTPLILLNAPKARLKPMRPFDAEKRAMRQSRTTSAKGGRSVSQVLPLFLE